MAGQTTKFYLLGTEGCHLCDIALQLVQSIHIEFEKIDIVEDEELVALYGESIPVFIADNAPQALYWPFEPQQLEQYIAHYGINSSN